MKHKFFYRFKDFFMHTGFKWDRLALTEEAAIPFAHANINSEPMQRNSENKYSLEYCLAHNGEAISERYRHDSAICTDIMISKMVASYRTQKDIIVYRGVCDIVFEQMIKNAIGINNVDLVEKGFLATSLVKGHELNYKIKLRIYLPAGTQAVYQGNVNNEQFYYEVDVQHNAYLRIVSADKEYINCLLIKTANENTL